MSPKKPKVTDRLASMPGLNNIIQKHLSDDVDELDEEPTVIGGDTEPFKRIRNKTHKPVHDIDEEDTADSDTSESPTSDELKGGYVDQEMDGGGPPLLSVMEEMLHMPLIELFGRRMPTFQTKKDAEALETQIVLTKYNLEGVVFAGFQHELSPLVGSMVYEGQKFQNPQHAYFHETARAFKLEDEAQQV